MEGNKQAVEITWPIFSLPARGKRGGTGKRLPFWDILPRNSYTTMLIYSGKMGWGLNVCMLWLSANHIQNIVFNFIKGCSIRYAFIRTSGKNQTILGFKKRIPHTICKTIVGNIF